MRGVVGVKVSANSRHGQIRLLGPLTRAQTAPEWADSHIKSIRMKPSSDSCCFWWLAWFLLWRCDQDSADPFMSGDPFQILWQKATWNTGPLNCGVLWVASWNAFTYKLRWMCRNMNSNLIDNGDTFWKLDINLAWIIITHECNTLCFLLPFLRPIWSGKCA